MKDIFTPIFIAVLSFLFFVNNLGLFHETLHPLFISSFMLALLFFIFKKYKLTYFFIIISFSFLLSLKFLDNKSDFIKTCELDIPETQYISINGKLRDFPEIKKEYSIINLKVKSIEYNKKKRFISFNIRIKVKGDLRNIYRGDFINIDAKFFKNRFNENFYKNPFRNYVLIKKNHFNGYCKSELMVTLEKRTNLFWRSIGEWRNSIREAIEKKYLEKNGELNRKGVFLEAILIGDRGRLNNLQKEGLLSSGVYHLFAISGAHIGVIAIFCLIFLRFLGFRYRKRYVITAIFLVIFLVLSGFKISAQRAVFMAILIFIANISYFEINIFNIISFSGLVILFLNPAEFLDPGFILTYTLTASIVIGRNIFLKFFSKFHKYFKELFSANLSASLISLPLSLFFFRRYSFAGFFAGIILLPLTGAIIAIGMFLIFFAPVSSFISNILLILNNVLLNIFFLIVDLFSKYINLNIFRASPSIIFVVMILISFVLISIKKRFKFQKIIFTFIFLFVGLFISLNISYYKPEHLETYFLDVGQGDSELIVFPSGDSLLIDGGGSYYSSFEVGKNLVLPFLLQKRIRVKWIAISHYHPDHLKGIIEIVNITKPEDLWVSSEARKDFNYNRLIKSLDKSIKIKKVNSPFKKIVGDCKIEFLFPKNFIKSDFTQNNYSQVIKVSDKSHSFLFTGDIEKEVEEYLVINDCKSLKSDVLKVPHHGSKTSSTKNFINCVMPDIAVFSYAFNNRFNFPHKSVLRNYKDKSIRLISTAQKGGIKIVSLPKYIRVETSK